MRSLEPRGGSVQQAARTVARREIALDSVDSARYLAYGVYGTSGQQSPGTTGIDFQRTLGSLGGDSEEL